MRRTCRRNTDGPFTSLSPPVSRPNAQVPRAAGDQLHSKRIQSSIDDINRRHSISVDVDWSMLTGLLPIVFVWFSPPKAHLQQESVVPNWYCLPMAGDTAAVGETLCLLSPSRGSWFRTRSKQPSLPSIRVSDLGLNSSGKNKTTTPSTLATVSHGVSQIRFQIGILAIHDIP